MSVLQVVRRQRLAGHLVQSAVLNRNSAFRACVILQPCLSTMVATH